MPELLRASAASPPAAAPKVEDVNRLLKQFDQMQQLMKQMYGTGQKAQAAAGEMGGFAGFPGYADHWTAIRSDDIILNSIWR